MKTIKKLLSVVLMLSLLLSIMPFKVSAAGTPSGWAVTEIESAKSNGLITEKTVKNFQKNITREEFCELAVKLYEKLTLKRATGVNTKFTDTNNAEIAKAYGLGIVTGTSETTFSPNNTITRQEICVMLVRTVKAVLGEEFSLTSQNYFFDDSVEIASWAMEYVLYSYEKGFIKGTDSTHISPLGTATCEQAIIMINRIYQNIDVCKDNSAVNGQGTSSESKPSGNSAKGYDENHQYVNNRFQTIQKKYNDANGFVPEEKVNAVLDEVYAEALKLKADGEITGATINKEYSNVCILLKNGAKYIYAPPLEGYANVSAAYDVLTVNANNEEGTTQISKEESAYVALADLLSITPGGGIGFEDDIVTVEACGDYLEKSNDDCEDVEHITYSETTVVSVRDYLKSMDSDKRHVIFWRGHGGVWNYEDKEILGTLEDVNNADTKYAVFAVDLFSDGSYDDTFDILEEIDSGRVVYCGGTFGLTPEFFKHYIPDIEGGLFVSGTCFGAADGDVMANAIIDAGFDTYIGATDAVYTFFADVVMLYLAQYLCNVNLLDWSKTYTVESAFNFAMKDSPSKYYGDKTIAYTKIIAENLVNPDNHGVVEGEILKIVGDTEFRLSGN